MGVATCLLLEVRRGHRCPAVGWSQCVNKLLDNFTGHPLPQAISAAPWDANPGWCRSSGRRPEPACAHCCSSVEASRSATVNTVMVIVKLTVLAVFAVIAFTAFRADRFADFAPFGVSGIARRHGTVFFSYIGMDAVSTAGDEVKDPQHHCPR